MVTGSQLVLGAEAQAATGVNNSTIPTPPTTGESKAYHWYTDGGGNRYDTPEAATAAVVEEVLEGENPGLVTSWAPGVAFILIGDTMEWGATVVAAQQPGESNGFASDPIKDSASSGTDQVGWYMPGEDGLWSPMHKYGDMTLYGLNSNGTAVGGNLTDDDAPAAVTSVTQNGVCADTAWTYDSSATSQWLVGGTNSGGQQPAATSQEVSAGRVPQNDGLPAHSNTLWNAWCQGPLTALVTWAPTAQTPVEGADGFRLAENGYYVGLSATQEMIDKYTSDNIDAVNFTGSNNQLQGSMGTWYSRASALNPSLQLIKQVCTQYDSTGKPTCTADSDAGWVEDETKGDDDGAAGVNNGGVATGVEQGVVPSGVTELAWRLTAYNPGNLTLKNVHVAPNSELTNIQPGRNETEASVASVVSNSCQAATVVDSLAPGAKASITCSTTLSGPFTGIVQNTAALNASFDDPTSPMFKDPQGNPLSARFTGNGGEKGMVPSNVDSAQVAAPDPGIKLTKWVCSTGTGCADPAGETLARLAGYTADGVTQGQPAGGWVKHTTVDYAATADWLVVVTNTGNTFLSDVSLPREVATGSAGALTDATPASYDSVAPGQSVLFHLSSPVVTDTGAFDDTNDGQLANPYAEPTDVDGDDVVNSAQAQGTPALDAKGTPVPDLHGKALEPIKSNIATAEANTSAPNPAVKLTKWVCKTGTGCTVPAADSAELKQLGGDATTAGAASDQWVKETTVPYYTDAEWLIVVTNIGDTSLSSVAVADAAVGDDSSADTAAVVAASDAPQVLAPGQSAAFTTSTKTILNTNEWVEGNDGNTKNPYGEPKYNQGQDVVNTAKATAQPSDDQGDALPKPDSSDASNPGSGQVWPVVDSNDSAAEANTEAPEPGLKLTKWVCSTGTGCDAPVGDVLTTLAGYTVAGGVTQGQPAGGWVKETSVAYAGRADWIMVATNTGNTYLSGVAISSDEQTGDGHGATSAVTPSTATQALAPGESVVFTSTTSTVINTNDYKTGDDGKTDNVYGEPAYNQGDDVVNIAQATGTPSTADGETLPVVAEDGTVKPMNPVESNESAAEANTTPPEPGIGLTKWVCKEGTGCADPTTAELAGLAAGTPTAHWVKETTVPYNTDAQWLVVVTNTGNVALKDVTLTEEALAGVGHGELTGCAKGDVVSAMLMPGKSAFTSKCVAPAVTNTADYVVGGQTGDDVVNTAKAKGSPVDGDGSPILKPNGDGRQTWPDIETEPDTAEVNTEVPSPAITLTKWVCKEGTGCEDPTAEELGLLAQGTATEHWVKETTVDYLADAQWLIVVTNTGDVALSNVGLTEEFLTGEGHGDLVGCEVGDVLSELLAPGQSAFTSQCMTEAISNDNPYVGGPATGDDVVNTAKAKGTPVDDDGEPIPSPNDEGGDLPDIESDRDTAEVTTVTPVPDVTIKKYDTLDGDDIISGDFNDSSKNLQAGVATPISFTITNTGGEDLVDIAVSDETTAGTTGKITDLSCDFSALGGPAAATSWAGPFEIGKSFTCTGTLPALSAGDKHTDVATVTGVGKLTAQPVDDDDVWNGHVSSVMFPTGGVLAGADSFPTAVVGWLLLGLGVIAGAVAWMFRTRRA
jgi:hypothetical protein